VTVPALRRNNVRVSGTVDAPVIVFSHGFGCDQHMWRHVAPAFADHYRVVLFDHVGAGGSDLAAYDVQRYSTLRGYADDIIEVIDALPARDVVFVGHSVSAMMGVLAAAARPDLFDRLVLVGPSARYIDDTDYIGGFTKADVDDLLDAMDSNYLGWSSVMAPVIAGNPETPDYGRELTASFCRADPGIARRFAEVTFRSDNRADLPAVLTPTLVLQCSDDAIAPESAGRYVADHLPRSTFVRMRATGHTPNLTAPEETIRLIKEYLGS
jgi:sigma-B regulation protein RsbQ